MMADSQTPLLEELAVLIRELQCEQDEYDRSGARERPLIEGFPDIVSLMEKILGISDIMEYAYRSPTCDDEECTYCNEEVA